MNTVALIIPPVVKLLLMASVGFIGAKIGILDETAARKLSGIVTNLILPFTLFNCFTVEYRAEYLSGFGKTVILTIFLHIALILVTRYIVRTKAMGWQVESFCAVLANDAFIALPIIIAMLGVEGAFYNAAHILINTVFIWSYGIMTISGQFSVKSLIKNLCSVNMIACLLGLLVYLLQIKLPVIISSVVGTISSACTPLALFLIGATIYRTDMLTILRNKRMYKSGFIKLFAAPMIALGLCLVLKASYIVTMSMVICAASPTATTGATLSIKYNRDPEYCSAMTALFTSASIVSIPIVVAIASLFF